MDSHGLTVDYLYDKFGDCSLVSAVVVLSRGYTHRQTWMNALFLRLSPA